MKKNKILYFANIMEVILIFWLVDYIVDVKGPLIADVENSVVIDYFLQMLVAASAIFSMWAAFNWFGNHRTLMRSTLTYSAIAVVVEHYMLLESHLLWLLPMLAVVYICKYDFLTEE